MIPNSANLTGGKSQRRVAARNVASTPEPVGRDIELRRVNRALRALSSCNRALVHAITEEDLLAKICWVIVDEAGYRLAWVGYAENDERKTVRPVACAGFEEGYLGKVNITWADVPRGRGPTGTAIRSGRLVVCRNIPKDGRLAPWRADAKERGYASSIVLPLKGDGPVIGAINIYSAEPNAFDQQEVGLLQELADDLVYGIQALRATAERAAALVAASSNEERFRLIVEASPNGVCVVNQRGEIVLVNGRMEVLFGYRRDELINQRVEFLVPENSRSTHARSRVEYQNNSRVRLMEESPPCRGRRKNGTEFPVEISLHPINMPDGAMTLAFLVDLTDRLLAKDELSQIAADLKEAQRIAHVGSWRLDLATGQVSWTEELYRMLGLDPGSPPPPYTEHQQLFAPSSWQQLSTALARTQETGQSYELELEYISRDGREGWMLAIGEALRDTGDHIVALRGTAQDITHRKRTEESLQREQALFSGLIGTTPDHIYFKDRQSRFVRINESMAQVFGLDNAAAAVGKTDRDIFSAEHADRAYVEEQRIMETGEPMIGVEEKETWPDGRITWVSTTKVPLRDTKDRITGLVGISRDITNQILFEERLHRTQRMEAVGSIASGVAHDFNNILAPMLMAAELLRDKVPTGRDRELLAMVESGVRRGAALTAQLLTFSRGSEAARVSVPMQHVLKETVQIMRETFPRTMTIVPNLPNELLSVMADPTQMHQVILNLCVNARDAMPDGGRLTLSAEDIELGESRVRLHPDAKAGRYVLVTVADTGTGIAPEIIQRIFDPFFTTKGIGKGTGLGLSTVSGIVKSHGGFITVYSEPKVGSAFRVYLPATDCAGSIEPVSSVQPIPPGNQEQILVVDDEPLILLATSDILTKYNYQAVTAGCGEEALNRYIQHRATVALVLTDLMMPGMGGLELIRSLRKMKPDLKIIATSGLEPLDSHRPLAAMGVSTVLSKPCSPELLITSIKQALEGSAKHLANR